MVDHGRVTARSSSHSGAEVLSNPHSFPAKERIASNDGIAVYWRSHMRWRAGTRATSSRCPVTWSCSFGHASSDAGSSGMV